jgi:tripartite-type tricarboxylate transporter receptor subunit TctC
MMEAGIPDFVASNWVAMAAPAGTPPDILVKINADVNKVLNMDDVRDQLARLDADPVGGPPGVLIARIRKDSERYRKIIDQIHLKVE